MTARKKRFRFPDRKISETFLDFASPLLELAPPGVAKEDVEEAFRIAFTTWNAVVFDAVDGDDRFAGKLRELTAEPNIRMHLTPVFCTGQVIRALAEREARKRSTHGEEEAQAHCEGESREEAEAQGVHDDFRRW